MSDDLHADRRDPETPAEPVGLMELGEGLLAQAHDLQAGRSARTLTPGAGAALKQTLLALTEGVSLQEHTAPGPATIQVLRGEVRLGASGTSTEISAGQWAPIPTEPHDLLALTDATLLLTVATDAD